MLENKVELVADETSRLLGLSLSLTESLLAEDEYCGQNLTKAEQLRSHLVTLKNEQVKLKNNEMVIAVVGTMKAGKSTTINAIVGTEVLPSRNRPMTALPTLIRHKKGKIEPELTFQNSGPIQALCSDIAREIADIDVRTELDVDLDNDMLSLIDHVMTGSAFSQSQFNGEDNIFYLLKSLNDLVRLSAAVGMQFPFEQYRSIEQIPVIEVEFTHLAEFDNQKGRLSILDTPGPNESGQPHLQIMLKEQLINSSAVLTVMDYTQLRSMADADVRKSVSQVPDKIPLFALVNKFDEKDRNGDDEEAVKQLVSAKLMKSRIPEDNVFPVSSKQGYLANRAKRYLSNFDSLPDPEIETWVDDFGVEAAGPRWHKKIDIADRNEVLDIAQELWEESAFSEPMTKVLHTAYGNASIFAIQSAIEKIKLCLEVYTRDLTMRYQGLNIEIEKLNNASKALIKDFNEIAVAEKDMHASIDEAIASVISHSCKNVSKLKTELSKAVQNYFKDGKKNELESKVAMITDQKSHKKMMKGENPKVTVTHHAEDKAQTNAPSLAALLGLKIDKRDVDFDPDSPEIKLSSRSEAKELLKKISSSVENIMLAGEREIQRLLETEFISLENNLIKRLKESIDPIRNHVDAELKAAGFEIDLNLPELKQGKIKFSVDKVVNNAIESKKERVTKYRRKSGVWGGICKFFGTDDWGWESYQGQETFYVVDLDEVRKKVEQQINDYMTSVDRAIAKSVETPAREGMKLFFNEFNVVLDSVNTNLKTSIQHNELDSKGKKVMSATYFEHLALCTDMKDDLEELKPELESLNKGVSNVY